MPKGKRKGKSDRKYEGSVQTSDDDSVIDNVSLISGYSDHHSIDDGGEEADETSQQEAFEVKITEAIDGLTQKSSQGRTNCFTAVGKAFISKYHPDFVHDRRLTISDCIERGLRKGRGAEQAAAAQLAPLLCVQLGLREASEEITRNLKPVLSTIANDKTVAAPARSKCCTALGLLTFLSGDDMGDVLQLMQGFQHIFSGSYLKGDGTIPNVTPEVASLHAAALSSWTLLLTLMAACDVYTMIGNTTTFQPSLTQLSDLLLSPHLEVRLTAGEALATVFELGRDCHDDFAEDFVADLVETLRKLATDSHKYRAKKDRKQQRATFRDILHYIENDDISDVQVKFGTEVLVLDTWTRRKQYDALCYVLGPGLNIHLAENELLREIFELGDRIIVGEVPLKKSNKLERHLMNAAAFKARTISRAKNRDKRSDF
ncbi:interferon-related developmental regulator 1 [Agrilus planipennis]|uniref:Interferon-related developmental regulator 1 n=1 Tax=Agrilus planipennis TaxID=224129 RepID=A0A1W4WM01_AGRPL|nr:interferon-related developmental regulator 1 [Agrilus planipennis]